jgi:Chromo (CHRromatin Organisation MOdifier) domain
MNQDEWAKWLPMATAVHNNSRNSTTSFAPNTLLLGWEPPLIPDQILTTLNQKAEDYMAKFQTNRLMAILALNKAASAHTPVSSKYTQGQCVWLEGKNLPISHGTVKLSPKQYGPFTITKLISLVASQLDLPVSWNIHPVFHNNLLTPYIETNAHGPNFIRPPPDLINEEAEYEVEAIKSHRYFGKNKKLQYLLKWKGYPEADNTWETEDQLNAPDLLKQYNRRHGLNGIRTQANLAETHPPISQSWSSIPTPISLSMSTPTTHSSTTACLLLTCPMSLPPPLRCPRPSSLSRSTPSLTTPQSRNSRPITPLYRRKPRSTSSPHSPTSTRWSVRLLTASSPLSTAAKSPTLSKLRSMTKLIKFSKRNSRPTRTRSTATSSSRAALMATNRTTVASPPSSLSERGSLYLPSLSDSETMVESYCYQGRSSTRSRTPLTCSSPLITHPKTSPSPSLHGSTHSSMAQPPPTTHSDAPLPISMIGTPLPKSSDSVAKTTEIWKGEPGRRTTSCVDALWEEGHVEDQEVQTRMEGNDTVLYPCLRVVRTNWV